MTVNRFITTENSVDSGVEALRIEYRPDYVYHESAPLRQATSDTVSRMAAHIMSQLANVPLRQTRKTQATKRFMDKMPRPAITQRMYVEAIDHKQEEPSCAGVNIAASRPIASLIANGSTARPVELSIDTGTGLSGRLQGRHDSPWSNLKDKDIAVRFYIPGKITADDLFKDRYPRLAISITGQLNGIWNTNSWLDDKVQPVQALEYEGYKIQYADAFVRGIGNACLVGEAAQSFYGGEFSRSDTVSVDVTAYISELTDLADAWFAFGGHEGERGDNAVQTYTDLPVNVHNYLNR